MEIKEDSIIEDDQLQRELSLLPQPGLIEEIRRGYRIFSELEEQGLGVHDPDPDTGYTMYRTIAYNCVLFEELARRLRN